MQTCQTCCCAGYRAVKAFLPYMRPVKAEVYPEVFLKYVSTHRKAMCLQMVTCQSSQVKNPSS